MLYLFLTYTTASIYGVILFLRFKSITSRDLFRVRNVSSRQWNLLPIQLTKNMCIQSFGRRVKKYILELKRKICQNNYFYFFLLFYFYFYF